MRKEFSMDIKKFVWALDHHSGESKTNKAVAQFLKIFAKTPGVKIHPVSVVNLAELSMLDVLTKKDIDKFTADAKKKSQDILNNLGLKNLRAEVKTCKGRSRTDSIKALMSFRREKKADVIVVGSRNKKGLSRFFMGSFAETLIFTAKCPTLIISPEMKPVKSIDRILFCSQLRDKYRADFNRILKFANKHKTHITLFNYFGLGSGSKEQPQFIKDRLNERVKNTETLIKTGDKAGIKVDSYIEKKELGIDKAILNTAKKANCQLIAMKGKSDALHAFLIGSTTRSVVRHAEVPVLIIH